jgi:hypothetical protein
MVRHAPKEDRVPRLLSILGFVAFVAGAVAIAVSVYILLAGVIGWNPFSNGRPPSAGVATMATVLVAGLVLLVLGAVLARAAARAQLRQEMREGFVA